MLLGSGNILAETEFVLNLDMGLSFKRSIWWWIFGIVGSGTLSLLSHWILWEAVVILKEYISLFFISS